MKIPVLCLLLAVTPIACGEREDPGDGRPSIVLISLDTTRPDHLSVNGYEHETTPNLARLALDGQVFPNFVTASSWTLPTHASLFTGLHPTTHGARYSKRGDTALSDAVGRPGFFGFYRANRLPDAAVTLAEVLQAEGYQTFGVGSGPWLKPIFGLHQGFEEYDGDTSSLEGRRAEEANALALRDLERAGRRPFFLFVNYFDPHSPYDPHGDLAQRFRGRGEDQAQLDELAAYSRAPSAEPAIDGDRV
ncbi:MAG: sulfatase-like hydrolase/transferase, partial [Proteobacteria bacterium]|nr:sulfatase-like hydrolase/transferase [Pseudomonadota bacterium]